MIKFNESQELMNLYTSLENTRIMPNSNMCMTPGEHCVGPPARDGRGEQKLVHTC